MTWAARKNGLHYRYYVSSALKHGVAEDVAQRRAPADLIERIIIDAVAAALDRSAEDEHDLVKLVRKVVVRPEKLTIEIASGAKGKTKTITEPWTAPHLPRREILNAAPDEGAAPIRAPKRARILNAIARSRRWGDDLITGKVSDLDQIAQREGRSERSVRMSINLAFLKPEIVEAVISGGLRKDTTVARMIEASPVLWRDQAVESRSDRE